MALAGVPLFCSINREIQNTLKLSRCSGPVTGFGVEISLPSRAEESIQIQNKSQDHKKSAKKN